ncbi:class I SAM-dependent DNA methyltransferase [Asticcacaulis sp. AND118]|uniref:HsdM family class I SAM-dependent methyltransferase n=1 Tax=Asticcacaulis sp. AND118 TaxID=2840468 RepID=UPI001CFF960A|nr:N-6 DNA methylase [Asticcacaulis sp. AND118]UDF05761.1 SAM-dependent methyltransferase [Asticcacaulis sp. AND118]
MKDAPATWLKTLNQADVEVEGLVRTLDYDPTGRPPEEVVIMEKAASYGAHAVFFEAGAGDKPGVAQALVFLSDGPADDPEFAALHKRLWSWGGVPLVYRRTRGLVQLFRCAHRPDFISSDGDLVCNPVKSLNLAARITSREAWWDALRLRNGTLWDDPAACKLLLSAGKSAHRQLVAAVADLHSRLKKSALLNPGLRRRLLILSLLIAYLEERGALPADFFGQFKPDATRFFHVLADGTALVNMLSVLETRFNGHVFSLNDEDRATLARSSELDGFSHLIEARQDVGGQLSLWALYSFRDLPVEVISHIYQLFVTDTDSSVYTPPSLVRLMLDEALSWSRLDRLIARDEVVLDPACGSGVFLVEAYKRLVLHWRSRHDWQKPGVHVLKALIDKVRGVDLEDGAIELAAFSLCLALCDSLEPEDIRASVQLFPKLAGRTLIASCFFTAKAKGLIEGPVGVVVGNPPFESALKTPGAQDSYARYVKDNGALADKQVAYLFLHEAMELLAPGGILSMLQQYNLIYNMSSAPVRQAFLKRWDVREILDFISIRGLFSKGGADTKIVAVVAEAAQAPANRKILHAVFRRSGRADAEQGFDIDYYDLHWIPRQTLLDESGPEVWRANLLGGARTYSLVKRLKMFRSLKAHAETEGWFVREGFVEGQKGISRPAQHLAGKPLLPSEALTLNGIDRQRITVVGDQPIEGPRSAELFTPPMLLIREQEDLPHAVWTESYLTYKNQIVGFSQAPRGDLVAVDRWLTTHSVALRAYLAGVSGKMFTQKATTVAGADILSLPYPEDGNLDLSENENIVAADIVDYYREYVRRGEGSQLLQKDASGALASFAKCFTGQINGLYKNNPLVALKARRWPGVICLPFAFGGGIVDWDGDSDQDFRQRIDVLLRDQRQSSLSITRIARIYDGRFLFLLKPDRLRYWIKSIALRDADDVLADLRTQGF